MNNPAIASAHLPARIASLLAAGLLLAAGPAAAQIAFDEPQAYPATTLGMGTGGDAALSADFNRDGWPDLAIANPFGRSVNILLNQGDGRMGLPQAVSVPLLAPAGENLSADAFALEAGDFDGDGHVDLLVGGNAVIAGAALPGAVVLLRGQGDGRFEAGEAYATGLMPQGIGVADFNHDGLADFAVVDFTGETSVALGAGGGKFGAPTRVHNGQALMVAGVPTEATALVTGDFDRDGHTDLVIAGGQSASAFLLRGLGNGGFAEERAFPLGGFPESFTAADLNGDGYPDLVAANAADPEEAIAGLPANPPLNPVEALQQDPFGGEVAVLLNDGEGGFAPPVSYTVGASPTAVVIADFDRDGVLDIVSGAFRSNTLDVLEGHGDGRFTPGASYPVSEGPQTIVASDLDGDGLPDLAIPGGIGATQVLVFRNVSSKDAAGSAQNRGEAPPTSGGGAMDLLSLLLLAGVWRRRVD